MTREARYELLCDPQGDLLAMARVRLNATVDDRSRADEMTSHSPEQMLYFSNTFAIMWL